MKKNAFLFGIIAFLTFLASCEQFDEVNMVPAPEQGGGNPALEIPEVIYASVEKDDSADSESRAYVNAEGTKILWENGDEISYMTGAYNSEYEYYDTYHYLYHFEGDSGSEQAIFTAGEGNPMIHSSFEGTYAVYPYSDNHTVTDNSIPVHFNSVQTYAPNTFGRSAVVLVAASDTPADTHLYFRNACAFLVIKLYGEGTRVKSIKLSALNALNKIAGDANITPHTDAAPEVTMSDNLMSAVTLNCSDYDNGAGVALGADAENATEFWFALPPVTFDKGLQIAVTSMENETYQMQTTKEVKLLRNTIQPMAALRFESNAVGNYQLWYTRANGNTEPLDLTDAFDATIVEHTYKDGKFVVSFDSALKTINANAFNGTDITSITLPEGLTKINQNAFRNTQLTEITIPGSVIEIDVGVFEGCSQLESLSFPPHTSDDSLIIHNDWDAELEDYVSPFARIPLKNLYVNRYFDCRYYGYLIVSPSEPYHGLFGYAIGPKDQTVENTPHSLTVTLGEQISTLYPYMFANRPIESIAIPGSIKNIDKEVFLDCARLTSVTLSSGNKTIGESAFENCSALTSITVPSSVTTINNKAFYYCTGLQSASIGGGVNYIGVDAFYNCLALKTVIFEPSPTGASISISQGIGPLGEDLGPFYYSTLTTIDLNREVVYKDKEGDDFTPTQWDDGLFAIQKYYQDGLTTTLTLGTQLKTISPHMFNNLPISAVTIPGTVTTIGDSAFEECTKLKGIAIPSSVKSIGNYAFNDCTSLASVTIAESSTPLEIGYQDDNDDDAIAPFFNSPLKEINLNRELVLNEDYAGALEDSWGDGIFANEYCDDISAVTINIGNKVKTIHKYMFNYLRMSEIVIPGSVTLIDNYAFDECVNLSSITFAEGSETLLIGFQDDTDEAGPFFESPLTNIEIYRNIKPTSDFEASQNEWDEGIFSTKMWDEVERVSVTLGSQVTTISKYMFNWLRINSITLPEGVTSIGDYAFGYTTLTGITISSTVTTIGVGAFRDTPLTSFTVPGSVMSIGCDAFYNCEKLTSITFEESPTSSSLSIGQGFSGSSDLGPFYYSPLRTINLKRNLSYVDDEGKPFTASHWDEGIFAYTYWNTYDAEDAEDNWTTSLNIGSQVTAIHDFMFSGVRLTMFWIPQEVKSIGYRAFHDCEQLVGVTLGHTTPPTLGKEAFSACDPLSYIAIKVGTKSLYEAADNWKDLLDEYDHIDPLFQETVN